MVCPACQSEDYTQFGPVVRVMVCSACQSEKKKPRLSHSQPVSHRNLCLLLNLFSNASDALRAARADGRHYVPLSLNRLGRVINTHGDILVSNAYIICDVRKVLRATSAMMDVPMDEQELPEPVKLRALCEVSDEWEKLGRIRHQRTT